MSGDAAGGGRKRRGVGRCVSAACRRFIGFARRCAAPFGARTGSFEHAADTRSPRHADEAHGCVLAQSFGNHAGARDYKLFVPGVHPARLSPLVVMLHGCNQTPDEFAVATRMNAFGGRTGFYVAYPAQSENANPLRCWNWFVPSHQQRDRGEPAILAGIVRHLVAQYPIDKRRIYVAGLSAGGAMAAILGRLYPELFAAIGVHSGLPYGAACDARSAFAAMKGEARRASVADPCVHGRSSGHVAPLPTIVFHGDCDTTVHPCNGQTIAAQSAGCASADVETDAVPPSGDATGACVQRGYTCTRFHSARAKAVVEHWLVHGGGHAWFGGDPRAAYTDPVGPDASAAMLRFFFSHVRPAASADRRPMFLSPAVTELAAAEAA